MWLYNNTNFETELDSKVTYGFVYKITNLTNNKKYIGKKFFWTTKTKQVKKKKKRFLIESDWKEYYGSNDELLKDIEILGKDNFKREILYLCPTKGECAYIEAKLQFENDVLRKPNEYYNTWIMVRTHRKHLKNI